MDEDAGLTAHGGGGTLRHGPESLQAGGPLIRVHGADGTLDKRLVGDHVVRLAAVDAAHGQDAGQAGIAGPAGHGLQVHHDRGRRNDGIFAEMGAGPMAALTQDLDIEAVQGRHDGPGANADLPRGQLRLHMAADDMIHRIAIEKPCVQEHFGPLAHLLSGLEDQ